MTKVDTQRISSAALAGLAPFAAGDTIVAAEATSFNKLAKGTATNAPDEGRCSRSRMGF